MYKSIKSLCKMFLYIVQIYPNRGTYGAGHPTLSGHPKPVVIFCLAASVYARYSVYVLLFTWVNHTIVMVSLILKSSTWTEIKAKRKFCDLVLWSSNFISVSRALKVV